MKTRLSLVEFEPHLLEADAISTELGIQLYQQFPSVVGIEFPSPKTEGRWILTNRGWAGFIPVSPELDLVLKPWANITNLFGMLEYAYGLRGLKFPPGLVATEKLDHIYESLASILASRILDRLRKGLSRRYVEYQESLPLLRGRVEVQDHARKQWQVGIPCCYEEHTADIEDNQILAWALYLIGRGGVCSERTMPKVRQAFRSIRSAVSLRPVDSSECLGRAYDRLNDDYRTLHALSHFFVEGAGPSQHVGDRTMVPFLIDMDRLFELFVARWLETNMGSDVDLILRAQERVVIDTQYDVHFRIDLVLRDKASGKPWMVLDTKYKRAGVPSTVDLEQITAYAHAEGCREAGLIYPADGPSFETTIGDIRIRRLTFPLEGDLEQAGSGFLDSLLKVREVLE